MVLTRAAFGPGVAVAGAVIGLVAMVAGASASWSCRHRDGPTRLPDGGAADRVHPVAWFAPVVGSVVALPGRVAHSSGSGWVQAVGALLAAVLIVGLVAPLFPPAGPRSPAPARRRTPRPVGRRS